MEGGHVATDAAEQEGKGRSRFFNYMANFKSRFNWGVLDVRRAGRAARTSKPCLAWLVLVLVLRVEGVGHRGEASGASRQASLKGQVEEYMRGMYAPLRRRVDVGGAAWWEGVEAHGSVETIVGFIASLGHLPQPKNHTHTSHESQSHQSREAVGANLSNMVRA
jgi:hypothetical protein